MPSRTARCCGSPVMSCPSNQMRPDVGAISPEIRRKRVVLPAPLGPMIERSSPRRTVTSTRSTARRLPNARVSASVRNSTSSGMRRNSTRRSGVSSRAADRSLVNNSRAAGGATLPLPRELPARERGAGGETAELLVAHVARGPAEAAVGVERELLRRADLEHAADPRGHPLGGLLLEALDVHDARAQLAPVPVLLPEIQLGELPAGELQDELVGARLEGARKVGRVRAREARAAEAVAEADVEAELRPDPVGRQVEEARHLLARDVAARGLVELDPGGTRGDEPLQLLVDDLGEPLGDFHHALVRRPGVDARAEGERPRAGRLGAPGRAGSEVFEVLHEAETGGGRLD